jgi:hypothetical protein
MRSRQRLKRQLSGWRQAHQRGRRGGRRVLITMRGTVQRRRLERPVLDAFPGSVAGCSSLAQVAAPTDESLGWSLKLCATFSIAWRWTIANRQTSDFRRQVSLMCGWR